MRWSALARRPRPSPLWHDAQETLLKIGPSPECGVEHVAVVDGLGGELVAGSERCDECRDGQGPAGEPSGHGETE